MSERGSQCRDWTPLENHILLIAFVVREVEIPFPFHTSGRALIVHIVLFCMFVAVQQIFEVRERLSAHSVS